ncbi:MAG: diadenylate cyclase CdaA [Bacilli bacterium]|nr:diadenylate cyclase CdaA [Bacilli bacterium]
MFDLNINLSIIWNVLRTSVDLIAVCLILYYLISMFRMNMKTMQLFKGVMFILILKLVTSALELTTLNFLVDGIINWGVLAMIIIFQPEIRTLLEKMGQTKNETRKVINDDEKERLMDELVNAITTLSKEQTGALITFERSQSLLDYINTGTKVNADIKSELLLTIFWEGTPLHDGATIIQGDRVVCAAAFYPPTNQELSPRYGARHRAALGISEITDSLTVVVSEETGTISFAVNGELRKIPAKELRASLVNELQWFKSEEKEAEK